MKRTAIWLFMFLLFAGSISAQKDITLEGIFSDPELYPESIYRLQAHFSDDYFTYANDDGSLEKIDSKGNTEVLVTLSKLNTALTNAGVEEFGFLPSYEWVSKDEIRFKSMNALATYNIKTEKAEKINEWPSEAENLEFCPNGYVAYTKGNNLYFAVDGTEKAITDDTEEGIVNGHTVHRVEFGIEKGIFWGPKCDKIAFYRKDESMVTNYPLVDINTRIAEVDNTRYPMAGMTSHEVTLGVYDIASGKTIFLKTGEPKEQFLTAVTWGPDGKYIYIGVLNRHQNHLKLNQYDATTGDFVKTLFEEKNDRYVEPENPLYFVPGKSDEFIWMSERDGFMHMYLYKTDGTLVKQITKGPWMVTHFGGFDASGKNIWYYSTEKSPIENHAYTVNLGNGKMTALTTEKGSHDIIISKSFKYLIDSYSSTEMASLYQLKSAGGKVVKEMLRDENPLKNFKAPTQEIFTLKADDGTDLYCQVTKPYDFDPNKKYPVMVYVYGGPHAQMITDSWTGGAGYFNYYMANQGYIVFTLDNRGSANRGFEFESCIHRNLGVKEVADQMIGVNWLKEQSYVDADRIGVFGWSYGGFMTISLITKNPGVFAAGVAGGPVIDWQYYEVMYGERYMDTPQENPEGYEEASLINHVEGLDDSRLLIVQGYLDKTVVPQHCLSFIEASIKAGKQVDFFLYPNHEHNVRGHDRMHLYQKVVQYFEDFVK
ncbi:MAG: S9 family peptidase [Marinilabiliales bacterium]|nr:MAG: S9 family peptidase [Marinilabiliales bacterium]